MKQSAVEWLEKEINSLLEKYESKEISTLDFIIIKHNLFDRAKEMEKQQQGYSEEEVIEILLNCRGENPRYIEEWFEQFKKK
jgi:hypothetical protein